jgi:hypothetical protein
MVGAVFQHAIFDQKWTVKAPSRRVPIAMPITLFEIALDTFPHFLFA